jgi:hypothetical protein
VSLPSRRHQIEHVLNLFQHFRNGVGVLSDIISTNIASKVSKYGFDDLLPKELEEGKCIARYVKKAYLFQQPD